MARMKIDGREYQLMMTVHAMKQIEEEFGDLKTAMNRFRKGGRDLKIISAMFRILANAGQHKMKLPEDVTGDEIDNLDLAGLNELSLILRKTMDESTHAETVDGGLADDEVHDGYADEYDRLQKKRTADEASGSGSITDTP